jgi:hypothetical protein
MLHASAAPAGFRGSLGAGLVGFAVDHFDVEFGGAWCLQYAIVVTFPSRCLRWTYSTMGKIFYSGYIVYSTL